MIIPEGPVNIYIILSNKTAQTFLSQIFMDHIKIKYIMDHKIQFYFERIDPKYKTIFFLNTKKLQSTFVKIHVYKCKYKKWKIYCTGPMSPSFVIVMWKSET